MKSHAWIGDNTGQFADPTGPSATDLLWAFFEANPRNVGPAVQISFNPVSLDGLSCYGLWRDQQRGGHRAGVRSPRGERAASGAGRNRNRDLVRELRGSAGQPALSSGRAGRAVRRERPLGGWPTVHAIVGRSQPAAEACRRGLGSSCTRPTGSTWRRSRGGPGSAGRRSGAGSSASPRPASTGCCATRPASPARRRTADAVVQRVVALTCGEPPGEATHWTGRAMAEAVGSVPAHRAADLGGARPAAAPGAHLQALAAIRSSSPSSRTSSASTWPRRAMPWCCRSTRRARSRP